MRLHILSATTTTAIARVQRPVLVSEALQAAIGLETTTRGNALKLLWVYIKEKQLQRKDATGKSSIHADSILSKVFSKPEIKITEVMGELSKHLKTIEEVKPTVKKNEEEKLQ
jgi:chromatin remodeling complex protein RSC6